MIPRAIRIAAVADYLVGRPFKEIEFKYGISRQTITKYASLAGFKLRLAGASTQDLVEASKRSEGVK